MHLVDHSRDVVGMLHRPVVPEVEFRNLPGVKARLEMESDELGGRS
jgi:hypothetical protein